MIAAVLIANALVSIFLAAGLWRARRALHDERARTTARVAEREALAREQASASERERIYEDLHDDLGARLLGMIHAADSAQQADRARAALQDLRDVVTRSRGTPGTLGDVLAGIRGEADQRLAAAGIELFWDVPAGLPDPDLDTARALHLYRIVREAISNVIRHADARRVRVRAAIVGSHLRLEVTDDGSGAGAVAPADGSGLRNMRVRAAELAGDIDWKAGTEGGTKVVLSVPLQGDAS